MVGRPIRIPPPRDEGWTGSTPVPLYWCVYGPRGAQRVLVLHGGPGAHHDYLLPQFLDLADQFELVFYDQRGGGRSKTDELMPITWQTHVEDLSLVVDELGVNPLVMIGYSWGALLALLYAIEASHQRAHRAPERLALLDPAPLSRAFRTQFEEEFARRMRSDAVRALREELAASRLRERDPRAYRQRAFELSVAGYFADPARARDLTPFRVTGRVHDSVWASLGNYDLFADLSVVRLPALIVHGRDDPIPLASSERAARALGVELVTLDACGHVPYVEQPAALFGALRRFLDLPKTTRS